MLQIAAASWYAALLHVKLSLDLHICQQQFASIDVKQDIVTGTKPEVVADYADLRIVSLERS